MVNPTQIPVNSYMNEENPEILYSWLPVAPNPKWVRGTQLNTALTKTIPAWTKSELTCTTIDETSSV